MYSTLVMHMYTYMYRYIHIHVDVDVPGHIKIFSKSLLICHRSRIARRSVVAARRPVSAVAAAVVPAPVPVALYSVARAAGASR